MTSYTAPYVLQPIPTAMRNEGAPQRVTSGDRQRGDNR